MAATTVAQTFEIVVPPGVGPGQAFQFMAGGKKFQTQCPAGAGPGHKVRVTLQMPAAQGPPAQQAAMQTAQVHRGIDAANALENEARAYFTQYDVNKNGFIEIGELANVCTALRIPNAEVANFFQSNDIDRNGKLDFREFVHCYNAMKIRSQQIAAGTPSVAAQPQPQRQGMVTVPGTVMQSNAQQQMMLQQQQQMMMMQQQQMAMQQAGGPRTVYVQQPVYQQQYRQQQRSGGYSGMAVGGALLGGMMLGGMMDGGDGFGCDGGFFD